MGIYDRDYYRPDPGEGVKRWARTTVGTIIVINAVIWLLLLVAMSSGYDLTTEVLACSPSDLFGGSFPQVWRLVTANFAHDPKSLFHIAFNMFFLWMFGRELEQIYTRKDFWFLYLASGICAIFLEVVVMQLTGHEAPVLGASASVMAIVVLYTLFYPHRRVLLFFAIPAPLWLLCVLFIGMDLIGMLKGGTGVAHVAHLTGAAFGFAFRRFDLRWTTFWAPLLRLDGRRGPGRSGRRSAESSAFRVVHDEPRPSAPPRDEPSVPDGLSERVDKLLAKISAEGMASLTDEERQFLEESSKKYRRR